MYLVFISPLFLVCLTLSSKFSCSSFSIEQGKNRELVCIWRIFQFGWYISGEPGALLFYLEQTQTNANIHTNKQKQPNTNKHKQTQTQINKHERTNLNKLKQTQAN